MMEVKVPKEALDWLLSADPWVRYLVTKYLIGEDDEKIRLELLQDKRVEMLVNEISKENWFNPTWTYLRDSKMPIYNLWVLADMGVKYFDFKEIESAFDAILNNMAEFGGLKYKDYVEEPLTCLHSVLLYPIVKMGYIDDRVKKAINAYFNAERFANGWMCTFRKYKGYLFKPTKDTELVKRESFLKSMAKRNLPCSYTTANALLILTNWKGLKNENHIISSAKMLLNLWEKRDRPYGFGIGSKFMKLRYPPIWYDIMEFLLIFSKIRQIQKDRRVIEIIKVIIAKADKYMRFKAESIYRRWTWITGRRGEISPWITALTLTALKRFSMVNLKIY